jgi:hypothetical protein
MDTSKGPSDFRTLDDPEFLAAYSGTRRQIERLPVHSPDHPRLATLYEAMTAEFDRRARRAWTQVGQPEKDAEPMDNLTRARLLAVEVLLADPEPLGNDALETDLYILREKLQGKEPEPR